MRFPLKRGINIVDSSKLLSILVSILEEVVVEYYGHSTWVMLRNHIRSKCVNTDNAREVLEVVKEFFGIRRSIRNNFLENPRWLY